jgi:hypothetical protein
MCYCYFIIFVATEKRKDLSSEHKRPVATVPEIRILPQNATPPSTPMPEVNYSLGHMGAGGTAIAAAASQAIAATQQVGYGKG